MTSPPRKRFAQHWLRSEKALKQIMAAAELTKRDRLLEIGPGTGILTRQLLEKVAALVAVEIDRNLCHKLTKSLGEKDHFLLLQGDFLDLDLDTLLTSFPNFANPNKVVANIPYHITGPILKKLVGTIAKPVEKPYESIVLLVQKEVGQRLVAQPGTKTFGALSLGVQYLARCELIATVGAKSFYPRPKVDSAIVRLQPERKYQANDPHHLQILIKLGFGNRRKMLRNNLKSLIDSAYLSQLLEQLKINPQARAEELSLSEWIALSNHLSKAKFTMDNFQ